MDPLPVYELGLDELDAGQELDSARLVGWRYLLVEDQHISRAAEISQPTAAGDSLRFHSVTTG